MSSSTLVETVSINYEDFSESFLTCATCLCSFDTGEHTPKLLPCSHTVCRICLERISNLPQCRDTGSFRCPICRVSICVPRGGITQLPPSFLVNQLMDLMHKQRRDLIPKCSVHPGDELLFCETCDTVFCHKKRMSEILLYKANQCLRNLNRAADNVHQEMEGLDHNVDHLLDQVNASFQDLTELLQRRRQEIVDRVRHIRDEKRRILLDQLNIIETEKASVQEECNGLQYQVEVRDITRKISDLNSKLDRSVTLVEPRENAFIRYEGNNHRDIILKINGALLGFGGVTVSKTFPPLCTAAALEPPVAHLRACVLVKTVDYHGNARKDGGDPVDVSLTPMTKDGSVPNADEKCCIDVLVTDLDNGTYQVDFSPPWAGAYQMEIKIFSRPIKNSPLTLLVTDHHVPVWQFGGAPPGVDDDHALSQPVRVQCGPDHQVYVLDTGNNRIKVLTSDGNVLRHIGGANLTAHSCTGMALVTRAHGSALLSVYTLNWRTRKITEYANDGRELKSFTCSAFEEPIDLAVDADQHRLLVLDNSQKKVYVFDEHTSHLDLSFDIVSPAGTPIVLSSGPRESSPAKRRKSLQLTCVAAGLNGDILVGSSGFVQVYDRTGRYLRSLGSPDNMKGQALIGGVAVDAEGHVLLTVTERHHTYILICHYKDGRVLFTIDSHGAKLKRPSGICVAPDFHVLVADLGNNAVKKYRYK